MSESKVFGGNESVALNSKTFKDFASTAYAERMSVRGAVNKTAVLVGIVFASAVWSWLSIPPDAGLAGVPFWALLATLLAFVVALITCANKSAAPITAPIYACLEGSVLGALSAVTEANYPGVVLPAVLLTFGTLVGMLVVYRVSGFQVTAKFRAGVVSATLAIALVYVVSLVLQVLGIGRVPFIHQGGLIGIGLSLFVVAIAALNLVLDFDLIETGARDGAPKYMEWYAGFGLMVTLIWLYLEILKLLIQLAASSNDN